MKNLSLARVLAILVAMLIFVPASSALAQANQHDHQQQAQTGGKKMDQMKMGEMKMDHGMMEQMAAKQQANTERINALMVQVKNGTGDAKVAAMADVLAVLLEERGAMHEHCAAMMAMMKPAAGSR
jgi:mannitol-specific phosphotransferase system IIBC component